MNITGITNVHSSNRSAKPKCVLCLEYDSGGDLFQHFLDVHKEECIKCRFCNRYFLRSADFDSHITKHKTRSENFSFYKCTLCPISFFSKRKLVDHQTTHADISNYEDGFILATNSMMVANEAKSRKRKRGTAKRDKLMKCMEGVVADNFVDMSKFTETSDTDENETKVKCKKSKRKSIPFDALCSVEADTDESEIKDLNNDSCEEEKNHTSTHDSDMQKTETGEPILTKENDKSDSNLEQTAEKSVATLSMLSCNLCSQMFSNETFLARHLEIHKKRDFKCKYVCKYCDVRYSLPEKLFAHFKKAHKDETPFSCDICNKTFSSKPDFSGHIKSEHKQEGIIKFLPEGSIIYACKKNATHSVTGRENADLEDSGVKDRDSSELSKNERFTSKSDECPETNSHIKDLETNCSAEHKKKSEKSNKLISTRNGVKIPEVKITEIKIKSSRSLEIKSQGKNNNSDSSHVDNEHDKEEISKDFEFLSIQQTSDLAKSIADKKLEPSYEHCDICDVRILAVSMKKHLKRHALRDRYKCHLCGRKMRNPSKFHYHMKTHFENDKFLCVCGVKFSTQALFEEHKRKLHTNSAAAAQHNLTVIRTVYENSDPLDSNSKGFKTGHLEGVTSQVLMKKSNEKSIVFNVKASRSVEAKNVIQDLLRKSKISDDIGRSPTIIEKMEFQPRSIGVSNNGVGDGRKMNIIIKKITPEEAEAKSKLVIKPVPVNEVKNLKTPFKIRAASPKLTFPSSSVVVHPKADVQNFPKIEFSAPKTSKTASKTKPTTKKPQTKVKKYLKVNMEHVAGTGATEVRLVHSNPLAHLLKEPVRTDGPPRKGKEYDYLSIIQKSLASQFDSSGS